MITMFTWDFNLQKGVGLLALSALLPNPEQNSPPLLKIILFFFALYLVALAEGGHKPCIQAFGAPQFNGQDPEECKAKGSFFNWWYFSMNASIRVTFVITTYNQDNVG